LQPSDFIGLLIYLENLRFLENLSFIKDCQFREDICFIYQYNLLDYEKI